MEKTGRKYPPGFRKKALLLCPVLAVIYCSIFNLAYFNTVALHMHLHPVRGG
jgi:hypothetical protein